MPCFRPLKGYRAKSRNENGKRPVVFSWREGFYDTPIDIPCGQCIGCRLERSRQWAVRCVHEASLYADNCFITLTFNDANIPEDGSLDVRHFQLFMKRLRKKYGENIRFFHCGEYGAHKGRPHYHACLFNFDFPDKVLWSIRDGVRLYRSDSLQSLWPFGFSTIGEVTFESAAYVARYIMKKVTGDAADSHYDGRKPEYTTMSRRPGIGSGWFEKYSSDVYPSDFVVINNKKVKPPRYYNGLYELTDAEGMEIIRRGRKKRVRERGVDGSDRLRTRELVKESAVKRLVRPVE